LPLQRAHTGPVAVSSLVAAIASTVAMSDNLLEIGFVSQNVGRTLKLKLVGAILTTLPRK